MTGGLHIHLHLLPPPPPTTTIPIPQTFPSNQTNPNHATPTQQADEEPVDTMPGIRESVKGKCAADFKDYEVGPSVYGCGGCVFSLVGCAGGSICAVGFVVGWFSWVLGLGCVEVDREPDPEKTTTTAYYTNPFHPCTYMLPNHALIKRTQGCVARIQGRGDGTCEPQYMEWLKCIDKYVSPRARARARCLWL